MSISMGKAHTLGLYSTMSVPLSQNEQNAVMIDTIGSKCQWKSDCGFAKAISTRGLPSQALCMRWNHITLCIDPQSDYMRLLLWGSLFIDKIDTWKKLISSMGEEMIMDGMLTKAQNAILALASLVCRITQTIARTLIVRYLMRIEFTATIFKVLHGMLT